MERPLLLPIAGGGRAEALRYQACRRFAAAHIPVAQAFRPAVDSRPLEVIMGPYGELLGADHRQTLEFFFIGLRDVSEPTVDRDELLYNASVLAHFAQVSRYTDEELPAPANLGDVFDHFVADSTLLADPEMMETAGAQCLLLTGFFEKQMQRRYNIRWYVHLGATFFRNAASLEHAAKKAQLLATISTHFEFWRERHARLSRELAGMRL